MELVFFGASDLSRLHFRLCRKLWFGSVKPSPATVHRTVALNCSSQVFQYTKKANSKWSLPFLELVT